MKKFTFLLLASALVVTSFGCGSSGSTSTNPTPSAVNDSLNSGVYKGVLSGSTGHFYIDAYNTDATKLTLSFTFDGVSLTLDGTETMDGENFVYTFSGSGYTMVLTVTPTGAVVSSTFTFTGHTGEITVDVDKATSTVDVSVWEGTWIQTTGENSGRTGVWNFVIKGSTVAGYASVCDAVAGTVAGNTLTLTCGGNVTATGTISGSAVSGTWSAGSSGTWSGTKTL